MSTICLQVVILTIHHSITSIPRTNPDLYPGMHFNSRAVALTLSLIICLSTTALLTLIRGVPGRAFLLVASLTFSASFILIYSTFEFLVFREIRKIHKLLDKIKKKELKQIRRQGASTNPLQKLNNEIISMASRKQAEIEELKRLEVYRREFLADVSHELKTPLFAAQGFIDTLLDGAVEDEQVRDRFLHKAAGSLEGLNGMVQEILILSQLETGVVQMKKEAFDLGELAREVIQQLEDLAQRQDIHLHAEWNLEKEYRVEGDRTRLRQVLVNLTENALKYGTPGGNVFIGLSLDKEKDQVRVTVSDDGPGIPAEHLPRIFERFYRVEKSRNKDLGGSGLGLAIVKQIVEGHGSRINVASKVGKGTQFSFKLKRKKALPAPRPEEGSLTP